MKPVKHTALPTFREPDRPLCVHQNKHTGTSMRSTSQVRHTHTHLDQDTDTSSKPMKNDRSA